VTCIARVSVSVRVFEWVCSAHYERCTRGDCACNAHAHRPRHTFCTSDVASPRPYCGTRTPQPLSFRRIPYRSARSLISQLKKGCVPPRYAVRHYPGSQLAPFRVGVPRAHGWQLPCGDSSGCWRFGLRRPSSSVGGPGRESSRLPAPVLSLLRRRAAVESRTVMKPALLALCITVWVMNLSSSFKAHSGLRPVIWQPPCVHASTRRVRTACRSRLHG
jgi:hypothetical protein